MSAPFWRRWLLSRTTKCQPVRRRLEFEWLETRDLMSGSSLLAGTVPVNVAGTAPVHAAGVSAPSIQSVTATPNLVALGTTTTLDSQTTDPSGLGLSYSWAVVHQPAGSHAALSNPSAAQPTFQPDRAGAYQFQLIVSDSTGQKSTPAYVTISAGQVPTVQSVSATPSPTVLGSSTQLTVHATDGNASPLAYFWTIVAAPAGSHASLSSTTIASPSLTPDLAGSYQFQVVVSDALGFQAPPQNVQVNAGELPTVDKLVASPSPVLVGSSVQLVANTTAKNGSTIASFTWTQVGGPSASHANLSDPHSAGPTIAPDVGGNYRFQLVVTDSLGFNSQPKFIDVRAGLLPSVQKVSANPNPVVVGASTALAVQASDPNGAALTYQWTLLSAPAVSLAKVPNSSSATPSFKPDVAGSYQFQVVATDSFGFQAAPQLLTVTAGQLPVIQTLVASASPAPLGSPVTMSATAAIPARAGFHYSWSISNRPTGSQAQLSDATSPSPTFTPDVIGSYTMRLVVTDDIGLSSAPATLIVFGGLPPTVQSVSANPSAVVVGSTASLNVQATDPNNKTLSYQWHFINVPPGSQAKLNNPTTKNPTFQPDLAGPYTLQVIVSDALGFQSTSQLLTVNAGHAPVIQSISASTNPVLLGAFTILSSSWTDPDDSLPISYSWTILSKPAGSLAQLSDAHAAKPVFTPGSAGSYTVRLVVTDSTGLASAPRDLIVTAGALPTIGAVSASANPVLPGSTSTLSAQASDPNGLALQYQWTLVAAPAGSQAHLTGATGAHPSFLADVAGTYQVSLVVRDSLGFSSAPSSLAVTAGRPPAITSLIASSNQVAPHSVVQFDGQATDPNHAGLKFHWSLTPPAGSLALLATGDSLSFNNSFVPDMIGSYRVSVVATDGLGLASPPRIFTVSIGFPPSIDALVANPAPVVLGSTTTLSAQTTDANGLVLTYHWTLISTPSGASVPLSDVTAVKPTFTPGTPGTYTVRLVVTDSLGFSSVPKNLTINVGSPPAIEVPPLPRLRLGSVPYALSAKVSNPNSSSLSYSWSLVSKPTGSQAQLSDPHAATPTFLPDVVGTYQFQLVVSDALGFVSLPQMFFVDVVGTPVVQTLSATANPAVLGQLVTLGSDATDPAGLTLTYRWTLVSAPAGSHASLSDTTAANPSFTPDLAGTYKIQLIVSNSVLVSTPTLVAVIQAGDRPIISVTPDANPIAVGVAVQCPVRFANSPASVAWRVISRPQGSTAQLSDPTSSNPSFVADVPGTYQFSVVATDSIGLKSDPSLLTLVAGHPPTLPVLSTGSSRPIVGSTVVLTADVTDADNDAASYHWSVISVPAGSHVQLSDPTAVTPSFTPDIAGDYVVRLIVTDSIGLQSLPGFVTVSAKVLPKILSISPSVGTLAVGSPVPLSADTDSSIVTYQWTLAEKPRGSLAQLSAPTGAQPTFVPDVAGAYTLRLVVTDSTGLTSTPLSVTLAAGNAPTISSAVANPSPGALGAKVTLSVVAADLDGDGFTYAWTIVNAPPGSTATLDDPTSPTPSFIGTAPGSFQCKIIVTDSTGLASTPRFVTVDVGTPPTINALSFVPSPPSIGSPVLLVADISNPHAGQLTYAWTLASRPSNSQASLNDPTAPQPTFVPDAPGDYQFKLVVTDSIGLISFPALTVVTVSL